MRRIRLRKGHIFVIGLWFTTIFTAGFSVYTSHALETSSGFIAVFHDAAYTIGNALGIFGILFAILFVVKAEQLRVLYKINDSHILEEFSEETSSPENNSIHN